MFSDMQVQFIHQIHTSYICPTTTINYHATYFIHQTFLSPQIRSSIRKISGQIEWWL
jgi:hypothetical protein